MFPSIQANCRNNQARCHRGCEIYKLQFWPFNQCRPFDAKIPGWWKSFGHWYILHSVSFVCFGKRKAWEDFSRCSPKQRRFDRINYLYSYFFFLLCLLSWNPLKNHLASQGKLNKDLPTHSWWGSFIVFLLSLISSQCFSFSFQVIS